MNTLVHVVALLRGRCSPSFLPYIRGCGYDSIGLLRDLEGRGQGRAMMRCYWLLDHHGSGEFAATDAGRRLVEAWRTSGRPEAEPWLDSRICTMLYASLHAGGRVPGSWRELLSERGFIDEEGEPSPEAYSVLETLTETPRRPVITRALLVPGRARLGCRRGSPCSSITGTLPALFSFMSFAAARIVSLGFTATRLDVMMSPAV